MSLEFRADWPKQALCDARLGLTDRVAAASQLFLFQGWDDFVLCPPMQIVLE